MQIRILKFRHYVYLFMSDLLEKTDELLPWLDAIECWSLSMIGDSWVSCDSGIYLTLESFLKTDLLRISKELLIIMFYFTLIYNLSTNYLIDSLK